MQRGLVGHRPDQRSRSISLMDQGQAIKPLTLQGVHVPHYPDLVVRLLVVPVALYAAGHPIASPIPVPASSFTHGAAAAASLFEAESPHPHPEKDRGERDQGSDRRHHL